MLSYYYNAAAQETQPMTAIRRRNFRETARAWDFDLTGPEGATVDMEVVSDPALLPYTLNATGSQAFKVQMVNGDVFGPVATTLITSATQTVAFEAGDLQYNELIGASDGTSDQLFQLGSKPLIEKSLTLTVSGVPWTRSLKRATAQSTELVFYLAASRQAVDPGA